MLLEAKRAGEALIEAKKQCRHGEFQKWVEANTRVSYRQAAKYMQIAKCALRGTFAPDMGIDAFLDAHAEHRRPSPEPATPAFTQADAEYALKLKAMADRGGTEAEREVAAKKLESFAQKSGPPEF